MKILSTKFSHINILDEHAALIQVLEGVEINAEKSRQINDIIAEEMPADYGLILDRIADYSIAPVEVYNTIKKYKRLKAIAIVHYNKKPVLPENTEKKLFGGELAYFQTIDDAQQWLSHFFK